MKKLNFKNNFRFFNLYFISAAIIFNILFYQLNYSLSQINPVWQVIFNDSIAETNFSEKSKLDNNGNIIIMARGTNNFAMGEDYVIVKYSPEGVKLWNRRYNGTGSTTDFPTDIVIDRNNNIYVTGKSNGGATRNDYLTLKYSPDGILLWSRSFNWIANRNDEAYSMALDSNNGIYVTGIATSFYDLYEHYDMVTVKYDTSGNQIWVRSFNGLLDVIDWGYSVVCDRNNNIYVSGFTLSTVLLFHDIITIKYDASGNEIWQRRFYNRGDDYIRPLMSKLDNSDNLIIASYYRGDTTMIDYLTFKYDPNGDLLWSIVYDGGVRNTDWIHDLVIDNQNNAFVTGSSWNNKTAYDFLTIKYSPGGDEIWSRIVNDSTINTSDEEPLIAIDRNQNIFILGTSYYFSGEYASISIINEFGNLIYKFRNRYIQIASSISIDNNDKIVIVGSYGSKIVTAKYLNIISKLDTQPHPLQTISLLFQNNPNPFNPITKISYGFQSAISGISYTLLKVFNVLGKEVATLVNQKQTASTGARIFEVEFNGSNLPSGIYYYSLFINNNLIDTKKMVLIK